MIEIIKQGHPIQVQKKKKVHTCSSCGCVFSFIPIEDICNTYADYDEWHHYDCPCCGRPYYYEQIPFGIIARFILNYLCK